MQANEIYPIKLAGKITRFSPLGDPTIEQYYHTALEQGRFLEHSIADANFALAQRLRDLQEKIEHKLGMQKVSLDGQSKYRSRFFKYAADAVEFIKIVKMYLKEIQGVAAAAQGNIGQLLAIEQSMLQMVQSNINALAGLLAEICNWHLPKLPSIPNLAAALGISATSFHWSGYNFGSLLSYARPKISISSFSFSQCIMKQPGLDTALDVPIPSMITTPEGLVIGQTPANFTPPLSGAIAADPNDYTDPTFIATMQATTGTPIYTSTFNQNSLQGSLPNPESIISNYQMDPATYALNVLSTVTNLLGVTAADERSTFIQYVTLSDIIASNYDPNLTAVWLFYLQACRNGRGGNWIPNFQSQYSTSITPSLAYLATTAVPWNNVLGGSGVSAGPIAIPLIAALQADITGNLKWRLSYIEAALLGYGRTTTWDSAADATYLSSYTGNALDYVATAFDPTVTSQVTVGTGTAEFPVTMAIPTGLLTIINAVIVVASENIQYDTSYQAQRASFRYTYNAFAQATEVDRFTQFWRQFYYNFQQLLLNQSSYALGFVGNYEDTMDSAIDPLGNPTDATALELDASTRSQTWTPGTPLLAIPVVPEILPQNALAPAANATGWTGASFSPAAFLSRPDIQQLPIPTQIAMLRLNVSYATLLASMSDQQNAIQTAIQQAQNIVNQSTTPGFDVQDAVGTVAGGSLVLGFPTINFDNGNYVSNANTFTVQITGDYTLSGVISFGTGGPGTMQVAILVNGIQAYLGVPTDPTSVGPIDIPYTYNANFNQGDTIQIQAISPFNTTITAGSLTGILLTEPYPNSPEVTNTYKIFIAGTLFPDPAPPIAVSVTNTLVPPYTLPTSVPANPFDGTVYSSPVYPIDPTVQRFTSDSPSVTFFPRLDGIALSPAKQGNQISVGCTYGGIYTLPTDQGWTPGGLLYAGPGGVLTQDFNTIVNSCYWIVVIGRAVTSESFIYEPNLPSSTSQSF